MCICCSCTKRHRQPCCLQSAPACLPRDANQCLEPPQQTSICTCPPCSPAKPVGAFSSTVGSRGPLAPSSCSCWASCALVTSKTQLLDGWRVVPGAPAAQTGRDRKDEIAKQLGTRSPRSKIKSTVVLTCIIQTSCEPAKNQAGSSRAVLVSLVDTAVGLRHLVSEPWS
jgi:hypothetical protein